MTFEKMKKTFRKNGFVFNEVSRMGDVAIYSQHLKAGGLALYFEVFIIQKNRERTLAGVSIPASESCPGNEQWGLKGWTYGNFRDAVKKQEEVLETINRRKIATMQQL